MRPSFELIGHSRVSLEKKSNSCKKNLAISKEISYTVILDAGIILRHDSQKNVCQSQNKHEGERQ